MTIRMTEFEKFYGNLTDHELAIFVGYQYDGFLEKSKEKIAEEIRVRNLSSEELETFYNKKLNIGLEEGLKKCPRCGSEKLIIETDYNEKPITEFSSVEVAIDTYRCRLCGFNPDKETYKNIFDRIKRIFRNNRSKRIINWNSI
jgi:transposase-like protein